jgi:hypothetical protein
MNGFGIPLAAGQFKAAVLSGLRSFVAQPARKISAQKMIAGNLNTRLLCGSEMRTQAVLVFSIVISRGLFATAKSGKIAA